MQSCEYAYLEVYFTQCSCPALCRLKKTSTCHLPAGLIAELSTRRRAQEFSARLELEKVRQRAAKREKEPEIQPL